jgi:hypothetical protein
MYRIVRRTYEGGWDIINIKTGKTIAYSRTLAGAEQVAAEYNARK